MSNQSYLKACLFYLFSVWHFIKIFHDFGNPTCFKQYATATAHLLKRLIVKWMGTTTLYDITTSSHTGTYFSSRFVALS